MVLLTLLTPPDARCLNSPNAPHQSHKQRHKKPTKEVLREPPMPQQNLMENERQGVGFRRSSSRVRVAPAMSRLNILDRMARH